MRTAKPKIRARVYKTGTTSYYVDLGKGHGKRQRKFFKTKAEAVAYADQVAIARKYQGLAAFSLTDEKRIQAVNAFERLEPLGASLTEAVEFFIAHAKPVGGTKCFSDVAAELVEQKVLNGYKPRYIKALRVAFNVAGKRFGRTRISTITQADVEKWLVAQSYTRTTRRNYIRDLGILFGYATKKGYCPKSIVTAIERPRVLNAPPGILEVEAIAKLLNAAHQRPDLELLPGLAVGFFAGLRSSELEQLNWHEIDLRAGMIEVTAAKSKTSRRRLVRIRRNLGQWLELYTKPEGPVLPVNWRRRLAVLLAGAGIPSWPKNAMRHSFASYHVALTGRADKTAYELGHTNARMLYEHYRELVRPPEAKNYWRIVPPVEFGKVIVLPTAA